MASLFLALSVETSRSLRIETEARSEFGARVGRYRFTWQRQPGSWSLPVPCRPGESVDAAAAKNLDLLSIYLVKTPSQYRSVMVILSCKLTSTVRRTLLRFLNLLQRKTDSFVETHNRDLLQ